jgi:hypothetical protein
VPFWGLITGSQETAEDSLHTHLAGGDCEWLELRIRGLEFDIHTASIKSLQRRLVLFD